MGFIDWPCNQTAVYWEFDGFDDYGKPQYKSPVEVSCRWDDVVVEYINPNGERDVSKSMVIINQDVILKSVLLLGTIEDEVTDEENPFNNDNAWEIKQVMRTPDIDAEDTLITAVL
jgi:hypothetical protein